MIKKILIILISIFVNFDFYAQDSQLFENTWYLNKVIINGNNSFPPSNSEVEFVSAIFTKPNIFRTFVCNTFDTEIDFSNTDEFTITSYSLTLILCNLQVNSDFEGVYFDFFFDQSTQDPYTIPFLYEIVVNGNRKVLTITNVNGDMAIYANEILSNQDFDVLSFTIFPNPVKDVLQVSTQNEVELKQIQVYDVMGKLVLEGKSASIDFTGLASGLYFVKVETNQCVLVKRVVKE